MLTRERRVLPLASLSCVALSLCSLCQGLPQPLPGPRQDPGSPSHLVYHLPCRLAPYSIIHPADLPHASLTDYISDDDSSGVPCSPVTGFPSHSRFHPWASPPHHLPQPSCSPGSFLPPLFCSLPRPPSPCTAWKLSLWDQSHCLLLAALPHLPAGWPTLFDIGTCDSL